jgi:UPF0755 protein
MAIREKKVKSKGNKAIKWALFAIVIGSLAVGTYLAWPYVKVWMDARANNMTIGADEKAVVFIKTGSTEKDVADMLTSGGIIKDGEAFLNIAVKKNYTGKNIVPGKYELNGRMTNNDLINHLRAGFGRLEVEVTFNNVHTIQELSKQISSSLEISDNVLLNALQSDTLLKKYGFNKATILCLFIPDTYKMDWAISLNDLLARFSTEYKSFWTAERKEKAASLGLSQSQVATLASLVMMEQAKKTDEWPKIAGLYINRIQKKMKLQSDPTVKYALNDWSIRRVLNKHLEVESPYNTYRITGLPPGPIVMPTRKAMDAVLNAEKHKFIYMCAKPEYSGYHNFAENYNQHLRFANEYRKWLDKEGIK